MTAPEPCAAMTHFEGYGPTAINPPEYCENDAEPGSEYCAQHQPDDDAADRMYDEWRERQLEIDDDLGDRA